MTAPWPLTTGLLVYLAGAIHTASRNWPPEDPWFHKATPSQRAAMSLAIAVISLAWLPIATLSLLYLTRRTR